ncbi:ATP-binding cassette domain-containing protein [Helicobacter salomonis]|uniref:ATP-binding cassette domain-containing protein n=1 Tax=Helicobacter salomonis TaxID=56878 RepID=UPI0018F7FCD9|nr:ABC transporter ATP-binding protein [Helicobacter salomonis]
MYRIDHSTPLRTFLMLYRSAPRRIFYALGLVLLLGVFPSLSVAITIKLINLIAFMLQHHNLEYKPLLTILSLGALVLFGSHVISQVLAHLQTLIAEEFSMHILSKLADKLETTDDLSFLEDKERSVQINILKNGLHVRPLNYVNNLFFNLQRLIGLLSLFVVIGSINIYIPFVMLVASIPSLLFSNHIAKKHSKELDALQDQKEALQNYLQHGLDSTKNKDNLLFNFISAFKADFTFKKVEYLKSFTHINQQQLIRSLFLNILVALFNASLLFLMIVVLLVQSVGVGAVAGYIQAFNMANQQLDDLALFGRWFFILNTYFENYFRLLDAQNQAGNKQVLEGAITHIRFKDVCFAYQHKQVLHNLNCTFSAHKIYAIVGKNASGKSTLIKLLMGFYTPSSGEIIINHQYSLKDLDLKSYRRQLSAIFQDFSFYAGYSLEHNLFMQTQPSLAQLAYQERALALLEPTKKLLAKFGKEIFGVQYNGQDFSGGQKQSLATLRAFLKLSPCIILDEPSSAIDPIAQKDFLDFIFAMLEDKMAILITHHIISAKNAHEILVLEEGRVVQQGDFDTLLAQQGLFAKLYAESLRGLNTLPKEKVF